MHDSSHLTAAPPHAALDMLRLAMRLNLHPEDGLHPSWLPPAWPAHYRSAQRFGPAGRAVLGELLRRRDGLGSRPDYDFDSRLKRLALLDAPSLRRLAAYSGLCAHAPLLGLRGALGNQLRRQARRYGEDSVDFLRDRVPRLTEIRIDPRALQQRPIATGRVVVNRGYRLLLGALAPEGEALLERVRRKLPHRVSLLRVPQLQPGQIRQLSELMLLCIVPERLAQWDWLF